MISYQRQIQEPCHISVETSCGERYWLPTVNCRLKELHLRSGRVSVLGLRLQQSNIPIKHFFTFEKITHFSLAFKRYIEKHLNLKVCFFFGNQIFSCNQHKAMKIIKYALLQIVRPWIIVGSFIVIYCNVIKKQYDFMKNQGIFAIYVIFAHISKIDPSFEKTIIGVFST